RKNKKSIMQLSKNALGQIATQPGLEVPGSTLFELPEKVLQFGTGVLLRALPDYFIDKANKQGLFNGRIVIVKSTDSDSSAFNTQDGLYTVCVKGMENGKTVQENIINASVSRVLAARTEWPRILECAHNPEMKIIISNTTEVGIQLTDDNINNEPPVSFPGKLLAFLYERFKAFNGSKESGMVIIPTELITDNGTKLESIVFELAHRNGLDFKFIEWLESQNVFCNSLVDRIVPGKPNADEMKKLEASLGYEDELLTMSEVFRLWAIEGNERVKNVLSFAKADPGVVIAPDINLFKELKLRLLNGTHTFNCGLAYLSGFEITREAVMDATFGKFARNLMAEIAKAIPYEIDDKVKTDFAGRVFERFCNPFIDHQWQSITVQNTSKMKMRNIPLLVRHYELNNTAPAYMATGFAGFLQYMKVTRKDGNKYYGERNGAEYEIKDDSAAFFQEAWMNSSPAKLAEQVMQNEELWGTDLTKLTGFLQAVQEQLQEFAIKGVLATIAQLENKKVAV
ncbi:MAG TPA: tagaturonate reductase, partial [Chitinophagaceae bacterium]|nr:tagaturonate reductase [Chitinophagaceae bacterium]